MKNAKNAEAGRDKTGKGLEKLVQFLCSSQLVKIEKGQENTNQLKQFRVYKMQFYNVDPIRHPKYLSQQHHLNELLWLLYSQPRLYNL